MFFALASLLIICVVVIEYLRNRNRIFKKLNIPGPEPSFIVGNLWELHGDKKVLPQQLQEWTKQYGPLYGIYEGGYPSLVTSDPDFVQEVLSKQFSNFHGRKMFVLQHDPDSSDQRIHMFIARGHKWKRLRVISNPSFSSAKIKQMFHKVQDCSDVMLGILEEKVKPGKAIGMHTVYKYLTLDVIARVAFAYKASIQRTEGSELLRLCDGIFRRQFNIFFLAAYLFPELRSVIIPLAEMTAKLRGVEILLLQEKMMKLVQKKKLEESTDDIDFIQLMLAAEAKDDYLDIDGHADFARLQIDKKKLSTREIASQSMLFILAGFETTSTTLAFATHILATRQDIQDKLLAEIDEHFPEPNIPITYEEINKLPYMDCLIQETLRMYPVAAMATARLCLQSCTVKGVRVPKGVNVVTDVYTLHKDERYWGPDAKIIRPERFLPDAVPKVPLHPYAYLPFGAGPRLCIGMRFAMMEMKVALVSLLRRYRVLPTPETGDPCPILYTLITLSPSNDVPVYLESRL